MVKNSSKNRLFILSNGANSLEESENPVDQLIRVYRAHKEKQWHQNNGN